MISIMSIRKVLLFLYVTFLLEVLISSSSAQTALAPLTDQVASVKPGCQEKCGNVSIPYPFGTTKGCYYSIYFLLTCNDTWYPPKLIFRQWPRSYREVTNISAIDGKLYIMQDIGKECYSESGELLSKKEYASLMFGNFLISETDNLFVVVGCDSKAEIDERQLYGRTTSGHCSSVCRMNEDVSNYSCSGGNGCCQSSIAKDTHSFGIYIDSYDNHTNVWKFNPCSYAFVVEARKFNFTSNMLKDLENVTSLPMVLEWSFGDKTCETVLQNKEAMNYSCRGNSSCFDVENGNGYRCKCNAGYEGNPYLDGCYDIDECGRDPPICKQLICTNTVGNYTCACPKGYRSNGESCSPIQNQTIRIQIIVGIGVGLIALLVGFSWLYLGYQRWKLIKLKERFFRKNGGLMLQQQLSGREGSTHKSTIIFTAEELEKATNNYKENRIIGRGGFGTVYKGTLVDGRVVAIKKSKMVDQSQIEQFINEVLVLSQINHRNVVKLLGCCFETEVPLLVYEFVTNGTLFDYIHDTSKVPNNAWEIRLRIASETAGVLSYLHSAASVPIIHRDVKSTNILLDGSLTAKVSDFGASRLVPIDQDELSTLVQGTLGYLDPEYLQTSQLTAKSDVYSFGVVLVELLTGKKALSFDKPEKERNLSMYFLSALRENRLLQVLDDCNVTEENVEQLKEVADLAKRCLRVKGDERPAMKEVAMELEGLRRMVMHQWVNDVSKLEETEYLLGGGILMETISYEGGNDSGSGYDTMSNHIILPRNDVR